MMLTYAAIAPDGSIIGTGSAQEAYDAAAATGARVEIDVLPERAERNPPETVSHVGMVRKSLALTGIKPMTRREVLSMSIEEAYNRIGDYFNALEFKARGKDASAKGSGPAAGGPYALAESFMTVNEKMKKRIKGMEASVQNAGLSLVPHALVQYMVDREDYAEYAGALPNPAAPGVLPTMSRDFAPLGLCVGSNDACRSASLRRGGDPHAADRVPLLVALLAHADEDDRDPPAASDLALAQLLVRTGVGEREVVVVENRAPGEMPYYQQMVPLPETFWGLPVVNGDESDLRPLDRIEYEDRRCIVGLRYKTAKGQAIDLSDRGNAFIIPSYMVGGDEIQTVSEKGRRRKVVVGGGIVQVGGKEPPRRNPRRREMEYLISPVASRSTDFRGKGDGPAPFPKSGDIVTSEGGIE